MVRSIWISLMGLTLTIAPHTIVSPVFADTVQLASHQHRVLVGVNPVETEITPKPQPQPVVTSPVIQAPVIPVRFEQGNCYAYIPTYAAKYGVDPSLMHRIIDAESGGNPYAKNPRSTASGCAQFISSTWAGTLRQMGREYISPFHAETNVEALAFKISRGGLSAWNASRHKWAH
jgi:hypothetical protein